MDIENTAGREEARQALAESRKSNDRSSRIIEAAREQLGRMSGTRDENHFTERLRLMFQGN